MKDVVKIPLEMITPQYYSETGYRFGKHVTAFCISMKTQHGRAAHGSTIIGGETMVIGGFFNGNT